MNIESRIKTVRGSLSQKDFADKIGVHITTVQGYEAGNLPKGDILKRIHDIFNVSIDWLLTGEGGPYINNKSMKEEGILQLSELAVEYPKGTSKTPGKQIKISDSLAMAARVLESDTPYSTALYQNIQYFNRATHSETRISKLENECEALKNRIDSLEKKLKLNEG